MIRWRLNCTDTYRLPCRVYRNLTRKTWSIQAISGPHKGRVVAHGEDFILSDAIPFVNENGRQRVIRTQRKTVHAYLQGTIFLWAQAWTQKEPIFGPAVTYNPYRRKEFYYCETGEPLPLTGKDLYFTASGFVYEIDRSQYTAEQKE